MLCYTRFLLLRFSVHIIFCVFATLTLFVFWRHIFRTNKKWFRNIYEHLPLICVYVSLIRFLFRIHILCATFTRVRRLNSEQLGTVWAHISLSSYCHPHQLSGRAASIWVYVCLHIQNICIYIYGLSYMRSTQPVRHTFNTLHVIRYTFYSWTFAHITVFPTLQRSFVRWFCCVIFQSIFKTNVLLLQLLFISIHVQLEKMPRSIHTNTYPIIPYTAYT